MGTNYLMRGVKFCTLGNSGVGEYYKRFPKTNTKRADL
jgi:hypothetical protein